MRIFHAWLDSFIKMYLSASQAAFFASCDGGGGGSLTPPLHLCIE